MPNENTTDTTTPELMTRKECAKYLKCSDRAMRRYLARGMFRQIKVSSRKFLIRKSSIDAQLQRMES